MTGLNPVTVYLPPEEIEALDREAGEAGRSGVSAHVRWILDMRREFGEPVEVDRPDRPPRPQRGLPAQIADQFAND